MKGERKSRDLRKCETRENLEGKERHREVLIFWGFRGFLVSSFFLVAFLPSEPECLRRGHPQFRKARLIQTSQGLSIFLEAPLSRRFYCSTLNLGVGFWD